MKALIADDESLARAHLRGVLESQGVVVVAEVDSGAAALERSEALRPDMVFLDIRMPNVNGMQAAAALREIEPSPLVVFVTGYSEYATRAFDAAAFDYLLKPTEPDRVALTLSRARAALRLPSDSDFASAAPQKNLSSKLPVRSDYAIKLVPVDEIVCAVAKDKKVIVRTTTGEVKTAYSLSQLERMLPSREFMRIHASVVVRLQMIEQLNYLGNHSYSATLRTGLTVPIGRGYFAELQRRLGIGA